MQAVRASNGHRVWSTGGAGRIYATAAVAGGKVFLGSLSGRVSAYSTRSGRRVWSHATGSYVYASAAVSARGRRPCSSAPTTAASTRCAPAPAGSAGPTTRGGRISGSATVIGRVVYFADLGHRRTTGLGTRTGRVVFRKDQGAYDPVISDGKHLYLTGNHSLTALRPLQRHGKAAERRGAPRREAQAAGSAHRAGAPRAREARGAAQARRPRRQARRRRGPARRPR